MKHKGLLIGTAAAATGMAVGAAVSHAITRQLVRLAIERTLPKGLEKSRTRLAHGDRLRQFQECIDETGAALLSRELEEVEIKSRDGLRLVGHFYPCENAKRVIVAMHGWRSAWYKDFGMIADFWHKEGCSVLFAEQRGQNNSEGDYMTFGYMERYDCLDWVEFVNRYTGRPYPVYLAGVSMGASTVLMASGLELPENVRGVIADCGFTSAYDIWRHVVKDGMNLTYGLRGYMIDRMCRRRINADSKEITTLTAMQSTDIPILFVHGTEDAFVPIRMTYENYKACRAPKRLLVVPGAIHGESYYRERTRYEAEVREFWKACDEPIL